MRLALFIGGAFILILGLGLWSVRGVRTERGNTVIHVAGLETIPDEQWRVLSDLRIFFGHQSVGQDLMDGVTDILAETPELVLNVIETKEVAAIEGAVFAHGRVGRNTQPSTKMEEFKAVIMVDETMKMDIILLKFCYVDFLNGSNPKQVFDGYLKMVEEIRKSSPNNLILHVTAPISSGPVGLGGMLKDVAKGLLGKPGAADENVLRNQYNEMLRQEFLGKEPIFDIALYESLGPDGRSNFRRTGSGQVPMMDSRYTHDGGHLNALGRKIMAEQLLISLANAAKDRGPVPAPSR